MIWLIAVVAFLALFGVYLSSTAGRLDRLHHRVDTAYESLNLQLLRRSGAAMDVVASGLLDPASTMVLADAALNARDDDRPPIERVQIESALTKAINATVGSREQVQALMSDSIGAELVDSLSGSFHRAALSRRFYNDAVRACRSVRRQRFVRWFRLAGHTPWPQMVDMDDELPPGFAGR
jgi:hypothetical protein